MNEQDAMQDSIGSAVKVRRGKVVYRKDANEKNKAAFRERWASLIRQELQAYINTTQPISDVQHCQAIRRISDDLSSRFKEILNDGELRYGISQKALNLYLKYLWRLRKVKEPPHCPIDSVVLREGQILGSWTDCGNEKEYMDWIDRLRVKAKERGLSLSQWEYQIWMENYLHHGGMKMGSAEVEYNASFGMGTPPDEAKREKALDHALDIRKFEIGLYWQRAAYFWALIAAAFAGYFAILSAEHLDDKEYLAYVVSCIGLLFTWAWCLVNRGSKQWQENWESHVDMLEDEVTGPLYKTVLLRPESKPSLIEAYITGPGKFSVSKINQWVSSFTLCIWFTLICRSFPKVNLANLGTYKGHIFVAVLTAIFGWLMWYRGRTNFSEERTLAMKTRTTKIGDKQ